ncbi:MAG: hypothetical protein WCE38_23425 [Burkholderiales bacterium]
MRKKADLKDKEQALIDAALRELATRKSSGTTAPHRAPAAPGTTPKGVVARNPNPGGNRRSPAQARHPATTAPISPIDHPTVDGWNHPAAHDPAPKVKIAVEEKWARVAAAMEAEQREAREARERMRRMGRRLAIGAAVVIFLVVVSFLR